MGTTTKILKIFLHKSLQHKKPFIISIVAWPVGLTIQDLLLTLLAAEAINDLVIIYQNNVDPFWFIFYPYLYTFMLTGVLGQTLISYALYNLANLQALVRKNIESSVFSHLINQSLDFHANRFSGALVAQANRFASAYVAVADILILQGLQLFVKSFIAIGIIAFFSLPIAGAILAWSVFFIWLNIFFTKKRMHLSKIAASADSKLTAHLADSTSNIGVIKSFANEDLEDLQHQDLAEDRAVKKLKAWVQAIKNGAVTSSLMIFLQFVVLVLSILGVMSGNLQIGTLLLIQVYITQLMTLLWSVSNLARSLEQHLSDAAEMADILEIPAEIKDVEDPALFKYRNGKIDFKNVFFKHSGNQQPLFKEFNLSIKPGEKIGLVGHSGAGKTTLTKLLLRFNDINAGRILIDDHDISKITQKDLRQAIAYVPQEPILFHRSLKENIAYGKPDASEEQIREAAQKAHADEFIKTLPEKYDTLVGERGVKLSGGQRQRIAIARAILKDSPILVLDEATSALDSESEKLIQDALNKLMKDRTTIVVAHRLSTIRQMDRIIVLDNGRIIEQGNHEQLLKQDGEYKKLWNHQSGNFLEED